MTPLDDEESRRVKKRFEWFVAIAVGAVVALIVIVLILGSALSRSFGGMGDGSH